jgi:type IV pilus assembly protein PilY1
VFDTVIFATNQPTVNKPGICGNLGLARLYQVDFKTASAVNDLNLDGVVNNSDRAEEFNGGGFLPSGVYSPVLINGKRKDVVCVGPRCFNPGKTFGTERRRTYWYTKQ